MAKKKILKTDGGGETIKDNPQTTTIKEPEKKTLTDKKTKKKQLND